MLYFVPTDTCFGLACAVSDPQGYLDLYQLKQRSFSKPCAVLVPDFDWLTSHTPLTSLQITVLQNSSIPFTILTESPSLLRQLTHIKNQHPNFFPNLDHYQYFAFRVAHHPSHHQLLAQH
ncbi:MAG: Sua5/YciO/YrdC/YwlC family protein [bacterium]|nr:Sua5/YciO/YrdC/YwlC family protein [bacterium]